MINEKNIFLYSYSKNEAYLYNNPINEKYIFLYNYLKK